MDLLDRIMSPTRVCVFLSHVCESVCVSELQVQVHPARPSNMFGFGETVFVGCQARGCAAAGKTLALYRCVCECSKTKNCEKGKTGGDKTRREEEKS